MSKRTRIPGPNLSAAPSATKPSWTLDQVQALGSTTDLLTAGQILGLSRNTSYRLARAGRFPIPVVRAGAQYRVPVAGILTALDTGTHPPPAAATMPQHDGVDPPPST